MRGGGGGGGGVVADHHVRGRHGSPHIIDHIAGVAASVLEVRLPGSMTVSPGAWDQSTLWTDLILRQPSPVTWTLATDIPGKRTEKTPSLPQKMFGVGLPVAMQLSLISWPGLTWRHSVFAICWPQVNIKTSKLKRFSLFSADIYQVKRRILRLARLSD